MIENLTHRVDVPDSKGETFSLPCDSDRSIVVALVPVDGKLAFSDRLFVTHRASGGRLIDVEFPPCDAGLERAVQVCDELLALPIDWSALTRTGVDGSFGAPYGDDLLVIAEMVSPIRRSAAIWVSNFWSLIDNDGEADE